MQIFTKVKGIAHDCVWAKGWLQARKEMGQHADTDGCLQEDVDRSLIPIGGTVMDATKCTALMRTVLGPQLILAEMHPEDVSSQSFKCTPLTWCKKRGIRSEVQNFLG